MEFRTQALDHNPDDSGDSTTNDIVEKFLENVKKELAKDPQKRVQLAEGLYENYGIDPQITSLFVPGLSEDIQQAHELQAENQGGEISNAGIENNPQSSGDPRHNQIADYTPEERGSDSDNQEGNKEMSPEIQEVTVNDIVEIIERFQKVLGDDATLEDVKEFVKKNEDIVQTEIDTAL